MPHRCGPVSGSAQVDPAVLFAALGDPTRLALLKRLAADGDRSICALTEGSTLTRQAVTKHLRVLEGAGLVTSVRAGRESRFACRVAGVRGGADYLAAIAAEWGGALARLKRFVEDG